MKMLWCWRCGTEMPMLDEASFNRLRALEEKTVRTAKASHSRTADFSPVIDEYERLTGVRVPMATTALHHRLAAFGPPCKSCDKPLRTPEATICVACGTPR